MQAENILKINKMEQMTVTSLTALFPETKSEIKSFADKMIESVLSGYVDPLRVKVQLAAMKKTIEEIESSQEFKDCTMNEAAKYHKEELKNLFNANVQIKETGVKYDYLGCGMPEYEAVIYEIESLTERKKALETRLKTIVKEEEYISPLTGECVTLIAPTKTSTTNLVITINK